MLIVLYFPVSVCFVFFLPSRVLLQSYSGLFQWNRDSKRISFHRLHK